MKKLLTLVLIAAGTHCFAQKLDTLTVEKIMRDPKWIGVSPSGIRWSDDSRHIYFNWNPNNTERDELFSITPNDVKPNKVSVEERKLMVPEYGVINKKRTLK